MADNELTREKVRATKGHHGYLKRRTRSLFLQTLILAVGVVGFVVIGYLTTHTNKNLMSVIGILTAVPMALQLTTWVAVRKYKGRPDEEFEEIRALAGKGVLDTELVVAKKDGPSIPIGYAYFDEDKVLVFTDDKKLSIRDYTEYLHTFLRLSSVDCEIRLFNDLNAFKGQLKAAEPTDRDTVSGTVLEREGVFRAISM